MSNPNSVNGDGWSKATQAPKRTEVRAASSHRTLSVTHVLTCVACLLVLKVTVEVVLNYDNYLPPDFSAEFLKGRDGYFFGSYQYAFYAHIASGPVVLVSGMILLSEQFRKHFPLAHRYLGRLHAAIVLLFVAPSGLWMACYASAGPFAAVGFVILSMLTATCIAFGWRSAIKRRFIDHRLWMLRGYLLLCSAVVLRILGGFGSTIGVEATWFDPAASWLSWLGPLMTFELLRFASHDTPGNSRRNVRIEPQ